MLKTETSVVTTRKISSVNLESYWRLLESTFFAIRVQFLSFFFCVYELVFIFTLPQATSSKVFYIPVLLVLGLFEMAELGVKMDIIFHDFNLVISIEQEIGAWDGAERLVFECQILWHYDPLSLTFFFYDIPLIRYIENVITTSIWK